ncbi:MAG: hypothetical protein IJR98_06250, partial [Synergistaceae bacterium]|nr:hypothetical protein [Synergistaceae bacterium]
MTKKDFFDLLKRKFYSLLMILIPAFAITFIIGGVLWLCRSMIPEEWTREISHYIENPMELRALGEGSEWLFILIQVLQVVIAPIPGQAAAFAGG